VRLSVLFQKDGVTLWAVDSFGSSRDWSGCCKIRNVSAMYLQTP